MSWSRRAATLASGWRSLSSRPSARRFGSAEGCVGDNAPLSRHPRAHDHSTLTTPRHNTDHTSCRLMSHHLGCDITPWVPAGHPKYTGADHDQRTGFAHRHHTGHKSAHSTRMTLDMNAPSSVKSVIALELGLQCIFFSNFFFRLPKHFILTT